jgi:hypothetical protein
MTETISFQEKLAAKRAELEADGRLAHSVETPFLPATTAEPVLTGFFADDRPGVSGPAQRVNELWDSVGIDEIYQKLSKNVYEHEGLRSRTSGEVKVSCPNPAHTDRHPSASINLDKQVYTCYFCAEHGTDKAGLAAHALGYSVPVGAAFFDVKKAVVRRLRGYDYDAAVAATATPLLAASTVPGVPSGPGTATPAPTRWQSTSLGEIAADLRAGTIARPAPTVGQIEGAGALFYPGKVNGLAGDSNAGKSFTALLACLQEVRAGNRALVIDYEEGALGTVARLVDMGATDDELDRFVYVNPDDAFDVTWVSEALDACKPSLVVIDSTGMSMALDGAKPNDDDEVARWFVRVPMFIASRGPAVVILDHISKEASGGGLWPIGSQRKRAAITGAQYVQQVVRPFSRGRDGHSILLCAKDRHGTYEQGATVARLEVKDAAATTHLVVDASSGSKGLTPLADQVLAFIKLNPGCNQGQIEDAVGVGKKRSTIASAIGDLKSALEIEVRVVSRTHHHYAFGDAP